MHFLALTAKEKICLQVFFVFHTRVAYFPSFTALDFSCYFIIFPIMSHLWFSNRDNINNIFFFSYPQRIPQHYNAIVCLISKRFMCLCCVYFQTNNRDVRMMVMPFNVCLSGPSNCLYPKFERCRDKRQTWSRYNFVFVCE